MCNKLSALSRAMHSGYLQTNATMLHLCSSDRRLLLNERVGGQDCSDMRTDQLTDANMIVCI